MIKRFSMFLMTIALAFVSSMNVSALTDQESQYLDTIVEIVNNEFGKEIANNKEISSFNVHRSGADLVFNFKFANKDIKLSVFSESDKKLLCDNLAKSFIEGLRSDKDSQSVVKTLKSLGVNFVIVLSDFYGNEITETVLSKNL